MSFDFHHNKPLYFEHQYLNAKNYVLPFINQQFRVEPQMRVLEIGCAEGGVLKAFCELGCMCTGVELSDGKIKNARLFMEAELENGLITFINKNVYDVDFAAETGANFDVIVLKDTIEHIPNQERLMAVLKQLLTPNGVVYVGFPPWYMPWGGHQQICKSKFLMFFPYFHLLPMPLFKAFLKVMGESPVKIQEMVEVKETGIGTARFEGMVKRLGYVVLARQFYFVNPIYRYKFGWKPHYQWKWLSKIPYVRDFLSTTVYYLVKPN